MLRGKLAIHGQMYQRYLVLMHMFSNGQGLMVQPFQFILTFDRACAQESAPVIFFEEQTLNQRTRELDEAVATGGFGDGISEARRLEGPAHG